MTATLGIDVAKRSLDVALLDDHGRKKTKSFANTDAGFEALAAWLARHRAGQVHACLEATSTYWEAVALALHGAGHTVSVVNPTRVAKFADSQLRRTKTDRVSATVIAEFARSQAPPPWTPPPAELRALQSLVRRLDALKEMQQMERNRLETATVPEVVGSIQRMLAHLASAIAELEREIDDHFDQHPDLKRQRALLQTIPGIGDVTSAVLLGELQHLDGYDNARQVAAYAGLVPQHRQSGTSVRGKPRLSKLGNSRLRRALYMPAITAQRWNPVLATLQQRLAERGKPKMVILGAVMRKLLHVVFGVLRSQQPFDPSKATSFA